MAGVVATEMAGGDVREKNKRRGVVAGKFRKALKKRMGKKETKPVAPSY